MSLGQELNLAEDYAAAEDAYRSALAIQERVLGAGNANAATPLMHLALNLSNQQRFREAESLFARAERTIGQAADGVASARLLHYRGLHALNQSQNAVAADLMRRADMQYEALVPAALMARGGAVGTSATALASPATQSAVMGLAEVRHARATVLARAGFGDEARALVADARELLRRVSFDHPAIVGRSLRTEAAAFGAAQQPAQAGDLLEQAAQQLGESAPGLQRAEARTLFLSGQSWARAGNLAGALFSFRAGATILQDRRLSLEPDLVLGYLDALAAEAALNPAAAASLQREMFGAVQMAQRGQTVRFITQSSARLGGGDGRAAATVRRMQDLDQELRELFAERDALAAGGAPAARAAADQRIEAKLRDRNDAETEAVAAAPGYRQLLLTTVSADDAARVLGQREVLVQILLGATHGYGFAVRADGSVSARRLDLNEATAAGLVGRIRAGFDQPGAGARPFDTEASHELYRNLFGPLLASMNETDQLVVIPDGPLLSIPFGLLLSQPTARDALAAAPWLIRTHSIVTAASTQALVTLRNGPPASPAPRPYIGFGDFQPPSTSQLARSFPADACANDAQLAGGLVRLPGTREEVQYAARFAGADAQSTVFGPAFTLEAIARAEVRESRILHLAAHALLPGELSCLQEPAIVVSAAQNANDMSSAFLRASEVMKLQLDADLVILSACNTGGPSSANATSTEAQALSDLARSFFYAGARGLLVTHWPAVDQAAAITIADMMRRQGLGANSATALQEAQLVLINEAGQSLPAFYAHPFYWAGFALIGDGRRAGPASPAQGQAKL